MNDYVASAQQENHIEQLAWQEFHLLVIDDEKFFSRACLDLLKDLPEVLAHQQHAISEDPDKSDIPMLRRTSARLAHITDTVISEIKAMPSEVFSSYLKAFMVKALSHDVFLEIKSGVFSEYLSEAASSFASTDNATPLDGATKIMEIAKKIEATTIDDFRQRSEKEIVSNFDALTDGDELASFHFDVLRSMVE